MRINNEVIKCIVNRVICFYLKMVDMMVICFYVGLCLWIEDYLLIIL